MHHESGYLVHYDADMLQAATSSEKQDMLRLIIDGMLKKDMRAGNTAYCLGQDLAGIPQYTRLDSISYDTETSHGLLPTSVSLDLTRDMGRLQGFIQALKRWPEQQLVMDVGCGVFPVLALATAVFHPKAAVQAIEINPDAAEAAQIITKAFDLDDRIAIVSSDIYNHPIDANTTAAITETFNSGLQSEPGPKIVRLLHANGIEVITPSAAELCLTLDNLTFRQRIDLRHDTHANIAFENWRHDPASKNRPDIRAEYYDDRGIVLQYDVDQISSGLGWRIEHLLSEALQTAGESGSVAYELGAHPFNPQILKPQLANS